MSRGDFGYSSLNSNLNANPSYKKNVASSNSARVISIVLDETHPKFDLLGGWKALGAIEYNLVSNLSSGNSYSVAYPLDSNIKIFPLINEIVLIQSAFDSGVNLFEQGTPIIGGISKKYYTTKIGVWNHPHHNAVSFKTNNKSSSENKNYTQTQAGNTSVISNDPIKINLGKTFREKPDIHPLRPFEGDMILEGRWGNSIRLSSTVENSNSWSNTGQDGDPIIIIRNGQGNQTNEGWIPTLENINNDDSSIYLTSTQNIPLDAATANYVSYTDNPPQTPNIYAGAQIILNSGRLVFNSKSDHILLSSATSINFNALQSVNIDTRKFLIQSDKIYLGKEELATEPLLLGNTTAQLLRDLIFSVKELTLALKNLQSDPVVPNSPALFSSLLVPSTQVLLKLEYLEKYIGSSPENCLITSKRNFTL